jgi:hypothetical protein
MNRTHWAMSRALELIRAGRRNGGDRALWQMTSLFS